MDFSTWPLAKCWKCGVQVQSRASILCPKCHAAYVEEVHRHDTPPAPEFVDVVKYEPPAVRWRINRDGRIIRKSTPMS